MMYEARLKVSEWVNGSGWSYENDMIEFWEVEPEQIDAWKQLILDGECSLFEYVTDSLEDDCDEDPEDSDGDLKYTMVLVEIDEDDEDDVFGEGKVIASTSVWLSELLSDDED